MRVLMLADYPPPNATPVRGPQVAAARLVAALARLDVEVIVVRPVPGHDRLDRVELDARTTLFTVPMEKRWSLLRGFRSMKRHVRVIGDREEPDVVHAQGLVPCGIAASDLQEFPRVMTVHGNAREDTLAANPGLGGRSRVYVRDRIAKRAVKSADVVVGVNPNWSVNLPSRPHRFVYIPNIVDDVFYTTVRRPEPGLVVFAGGAQAIKGWPLLRTAWPIVRRTVANARLLLLGWPADTHPDLPAIHTITAEDWLSKEEVAARLARASVLVIPSEFEVSPLVLGEAWALGLPVVATAVGGLASLAEGAALIIAKRDPLELADGITRALAAGPAVETLVAEAHRRAEAFRADAVAGSHVTLYRELMDRAGSL